MNSFECIRLTAAEQLVEKLAATEFAILIKRNAVKNRQIRHLPLS